jgi:hypothetical protein
MKALGTLVYRAMGATVLDASMYEGIEADPAATGQALVISPGATLHFRLRQNKGG